MDPVTGVERLAFAFFQGLARMLNLSTQWAFLLALVAMTSAATLVVAVPLMLRGAGAAAAVDVRRLAMPALAAVVLAAASGAIYLRTGTPELATALPGVPHALVSSGDDPMQTPAAAGSMEEAANRLAERLRATPGDIEGWRLLAQSYEVLGRADAARDAWGHVPGGRGDGTSMNSVSVGAEELRQSSLPKDDDLTSLAKLALSRPQDADAWVTLAQAYRLKRRFPDAVNAYARAARIGRLSADAWADYADALAAGNGGKLTGAPEAAIGKALAQDADHPKALWLLGSAQVERRDYRAALQTWQHLARGMAPNSPDLRAIEGNIVEARAALGEKAVKVAAPAAVRIAGTVTVSPALRTRMDPDDTLFVVAKSGNGGPPYAVLRKRAADLPLDFQLDDSMAMVPGRSLSTAGSVIVEARVSKSGDAMPRSGDLRATVGPVNAAGTSRIALVLSELVP